MIDAYLHNIDELLSTSEIVSDVEVIRRSIRDTDLEKVLNYRYRVTLANGGLIEMTERVLEKEGILEVTKYRHHWQNLQGLLIKRWDNAPHYCNIDTFPHHLHDGAEDNVVRHPAVTGLEVLERILIDTTLATQAAVCDYTEKERRLTDLEIEAGGMDYGFEMNGILGIDGLIHSCSSEFYL